MRRAPCLLVLLFLVISCTQTPAETASVPTVALATVEPATATPPADTPIPTPEPLRPSDIFARLSPSLAHISTASGSGSGALLKSGYILTNAHVVWPYETANITFPGGKAISDVPLAAVDSLLDLALMGPVDTDALPIDFVDGESAVVGSDILLIGYPGETNRTPQPVLTEGLISRVRQWEDTGLTFFQTSSAVAAGQSGGIAVTLEGDVIGLTGLRFTEVGYGLVASATDIMPIVETMIADAAVTTPDSEEVETTDSAFVRLSNGKETIAYRVVAPPDTAVEISLDGDQDILVGAYLPDGTELAYADDHYDGAEDIEFRTPASNVPVFVIVELADGRAGGLYQLESNQPLAEIVDLDDGRPVNIGESYVGTVHFPYDNDSLIILLDEGEEVTVRVDTIGFDPLLVIDPKAGPESYVGDDDSGGGLFDKNPELTYRAPNSGTVNAVVIDLLGSGAGSSYTITVQPPYEGAPTPMSPAPTPTPIVSAVGDMRLYDDPNLPFTFQVPVDFETESASPFCQQVAGQSQQSACLSAAPPGVSLLTIYAVAESADMLGGGEITLEQYVELVRQQITANPAITGVTEHPMETAEGDPAILLEIPGPSDQLKFLRFVHVTGNRTAANLVLIYHPSLQEVVDYIISTFQVR